MQVLLLHPDDHPTSGPWVGLHWDQVFDLARSGWAACERWSETFGCPVKPIDSFREGNRQIRRVRELLDLGLGRLADQEGLDWWELTSILHHQQLEALVLLRAFADSVPADAQVSITRDGFEAQALRILLGPRLQLTSSHNGTRRKGIRHYINRVRQLPNAQILQTLGDKFDAGYRIRRYWHRRPQSGGEPVVLLPSAYVNVSKIQSEYARLVPDTKFLLVATRHSGRLNDVPQNVTQEWLAAYAGTPASSDGQRRISEKWEHLKAELKTIPEWATLLNLGCMDDFPHRFSDGLAVRDAWLRVFDTEPVSAVLCGDDSNPYTHIPLLLAAKRGLPTLVCHHGGLDGRYLIKTNHADVVLAKGRMEWDYLVNGCGVDRAQVEIGAPSVPVPVSRKGTQKSEWIVFFSEPYEMSSGRTEEIYRDILPRLVDLAANGNRKLAVKLHPSENLRERQAIARRVLTDSSCATLTWLSGRLQPELLQQVWFGVTVLSSVVLDCAVHDVPCFLCDWLDLWPYGYAEQYRRFGVGMGLRSPSDIARIPELLAARKVSRGVVDDCWEAIHAARLEELLVGRQTAVPVRMQRA